jgi:hypothetical protein
MGVTTNNTPVMCKRKRKVMEGGITPLKYKKMTKLSHRVGKKMESEMEAAEIALMEKYEKIEEDLEEKYEDKRKQLEAKHEEEYKNERKQLEARHEKEIETLASQNEKMMKLFQKC